MLPLADVVRDIRRRRLLLRLTQADLAREAKTSQSLVAKLERHRLQPGYETVRRLVEALDRLSVSEEGNARQLMQADPLWAEPDEELGDALHRMKEHGYSQLPVVDRGIPVGSISERAVLDRIERGADLARLRHQPVRSVMEDGFPVVRPDTPRRTLVELLKAHDAVLVMREGRVAGVVTKSDLW